MNKTLSNTNTERSRRAERAERNLVRINGPAFVLALVVMTVAVFGGMLLNNAGLSDDGLALYFIVSGLVALYFLYALKIARQWEKAVVLRLGKFRSLAGPGMFWVIPVIDNLANWI